MKIPDTLKGLFFIERDSKRFAEIGGWAYAHFDYDNATDKFTPEGSGIDCGTQCHTIVKAKDYIFTSYGKR